MPAGNYIDPRLFADERFAGLTPSAKVLFLGIVATSDVRGQRKADAASLKADIFPLPPPRDLDAISGLLHEVVNSHLVHLDDEKPDEPMLQIIDWRVDERPDPKKKDEKEPPPEYIRPVKKARS